MKRFGYCQMCGSHRRLIDAHIIPKAFYPELDGSLRVYGTEIRHPPRRPKGSYDQKILCAECDAQLGRFDDYAARVLRPWPRRADYIRLDNGLISRGPVTKYTGYWIRRPDVGLLQGFAASLLWRAGLTSQDEVSIDVPADIQSRARKVFLEDDEASYFHVMSARLSKGPLSEMVARPVHMTEPFAPGFQFLMSGIILTIVAKRLPAPHQTPLLLGFSDDWMVTFHPFFGTAYERSLWEVVDAHPD